MKPSAVFLVPICVVLLFRCGWAGAAPALGLYQARAIVTGTGEATRRPGLAQCFIDVLVKASGDARLAQDPQAAALASDAGDYVSTIAYQDRLAHLPVHDEQGTHDRPYDLTATFDPGKTDAALRRLGREPWTAERPRVVVFLAVRNPAQTFILASDGEGGAGMQDALAEAAERAGLPIRLPSREALAQAMVTSETLAGADPKNLAAAAAKEGGVPLVGSLVWSDEALGWIAEWRVASGGKEYRWGIRGVSFDAAFRSGLLGAAQVLSGHGQPG